MAPLGPTGFWSYTSQDDSASRGRLSRLRSMLADEIQQGVGRIPRVNIFQDVAAIPPGTDWEKQIREAIAQASFLIPIITPGFLQSEWCCNELLYFREHERTQGRDDLIFPIYYNDVTDFETFRRAELYDPNVLRLLRERQWVDFRDLRHSDLDSEAVAKRIERVASGIRSALYRGVPLGRSPLQGQPPPAPASREPSEPAPPQPVVPAKSGGRTKWLAWGGAAAILFVLLVFGIMQSTKPGGDGNPDAPGPVVVTPPAPVVAPDPNPVDLGAKMFLVFFDWDRSDLTARARGIAADAASFAQQTHYTRIDVDGNNDTSQSADYSMAISERRARVVAAELVRDGVPQAAISIHAYGSTKLLVPTGPGVREPQNRRVEIIFEGAGR